MAIVPATSHGLPASGGTISGPVTIDLAGQPSQIGLFIKAAAAQAQDLILVDDGSGNDMLAVDQSGGLSLGASFTGGGNGIIQATRVSPTTLSAPATVATAPAASAASTLALGTAYQNVLGYDVLLLVCLNVTVNTSGVLKLGVGPTNTPTQQNIVSGVTTTGQWFVPIYLPASYFALLSVTGTITVAIDGQIAMPV